MTGRTAERPRRHTASAPRAPYHHGDLKNALIRAGAEILAQEGVPGLTLRRAAQRAGVSHSAPYAHFADKQALIAAISTEGVRRVRARIAEASARHADDPRRRLVETAVETVRFALEQPDLYRVTFSNAIGREADYPDYVAAAHDGFAELVEVVRACQAEGVLARGPAEPLAIELWGLVHGVISLVLNGQVPQRVLARTSPRALVLRALAARLAPARRVRP
ncbi:MAG: TetR/AcrR family transcriptional regulator [Anaeromyxobacter sp.]